MKVFEHKKESINEVVKMNKSSRQQALRQKQKDVLISSTAHASPLKDRLTTNEPIQAIQKELEPAINQTIHAKYSPPQRINFNGTRYKD